jgi:hypothetical protein
MPGTSGTSFGSSSIGATASISGAILGAVQSINEGRVSKAQADYNAALMEGKAQWIDLEKATEAGQYERFKGKFIGKSMASMAGAGLMPSGSPMAVLVDSLTQINIDKAIGQFNLEQQKRYDINAADMSRIQGQNAMSQANTNAFTSMLKGGYQASSYIK